MDLFLKLAAFLAISAGIGYLFRFFYVVRKPLSSRVLIKVNEHKIIGYAIGVVVLAAFNAVGG